MALPNGKFVLDDDTPRSSKTTINIAGFNVYLYGVDELTPEQARDTTVVFHIHGRTRTYKDAEDLAHQVLHDLRQRPATRKGLVLATFDNRNHGERAIDAISIADWNGGNQKHGQDMLSTMDGIVADVQTIMTFLESYVDGQFAPTQFIIGGMSLGGHVSWDVLARDPRVDAAIIVVGCPDLTHMLHERLDGYLRTDGASQQSSSPKEWPDSVERLYVARDQKVAEITGKKILILNGEIDTLVPSKFTRTWLDKYGAKNDVIFVEQEVTGHALSVQMVERIVDWLPQFLA
ncbi:hypothetical protein SBRCBS47491_008793 [Sporothrix bragantina]|uniref:Peptidase S9 prolyl oligopeptidase catalytic domain-containing protein n=1 Tax=Sporothrix bragantina TaxID=671064 RepID=A0ABP0CPF5_9PEZI